MIPNNTTSNKNNWDIVLIFIPNVLSNPISLCIEVISLDRRLVNNEIVNSVSITINQIAIFIITDKISSLKFIIEFK